MQAPCFADEESRTLPNTPEGVVGRGRPDSGPFTSLSVLFVQPTGSIKCVCFPADLNLEPSSPKIEPVLLNAGY